jgi:hypothetical protein
MKYLLILPILVLMLAGIACSSGTTETAEDIGTLTLNMTDAPIDADTVAGVYISITKVEIGDKASAEVEWVELADYSDAPKVINLLDYTGGLAYEIGEFELEAGQYNQIRFYLDAPEEGQGAPTSPGCYIEFTDPEVEDAPLFVPSGSQSGYKAVGAFVITENGDTEVTVDFDVRKSVHVTGGQGQNQRYILKPTLRLIVDSQAGHIGGDITNGSQYSDITVYAYQAGEYENTEADDPVEGEARFANAVTSCRMGEDGSYKLAYMANGNYDLIVVGHNGEAFGEVLGIMNIIQVQNQQQTNQPIDTDDLEDTGTLTLSMTDAPIDADTVAGVYISITKVEIGDNASDPVEWLEIADYSDAPKVINLLDYTGGLAYEIGEFELEAGQYNQIRFYLDAPEDGQGAPTSPGCYIEFTDPEVEDAPLFVPSGSQSGYKAVGSFEVPENGDVEITVDFDVRKSVHVTGSGQGQADPRYLLKPTLRLIVDSEAGNITGTVNDESGLIDTYAFVAYAYEEDDWETDEYNTPDADGKYFTGAATSTNVDAETGEFTLAYLAQDMDYIVVIVILNEDGTINEIPIVVDDDVKIQPLDQNTVNLGTLNTSDYEIIIPSIV